MGNDINKIETAIYYKKQENKSQKILNKLHLRKPNKWQLLDTTKDSDIKKLKKRNLTK